MKQIRAIRIRKRAEMDGNQQPAPADSRESRSAQESGSTAPQTGLKAEHRGWNGLGGWNAEQSGVKAEQKMKSIVAGWIRERRERSDELHRNLAAAFRKGLPLPSLAD